MDLIDAKSLRKGIADIPDPLRARLAELFFDPLTVRGFLIQAIDTHFQSPQGFLERLLKGPAHGHDLAHGLHLSGEMGIGRGKFFECKTGHFGDHIINRRLKGGRRCATGDVVFELIEGVADCEFGGDFGNRKACGFRGQGRGTRDPGIHLDHN